MPRSLLPPCPPGAITHPLEMFPPLRRWPRSVPRDILYTFLWNTLVALFFAGLTVVFDARAPFGGVLRAIFVIAQCIGFAIHILFMVLDRLLPGMHQKSMAVRFTYYTSVPIAGVFLGYPVAAYFLGYTNFFAWLFTPRSIASMVFLSLLISAILLAIFMQRERAARAEAAMALEQARVAAAERAAMLAQLKLLEAQVEPHFLYNTLAHVLSLIDGDPGNARRMLERLIELLRATAAKPDGSGTLGEQLDWLRAYLGILELRMGRRLTWRIDVPEELHALVMPPMVLQPVVENAIKHGLEPKIDGGHVEISARRDGEGVRLIVRDSGVGFAATRPAGRDCLGLANLRARLAAWYGETGRLVIEDNQPAGACVSVLLPGAATP